MISFRKARHQSLAPSAAERRRFGIVVGLLLLASCAQRQGLSDADIAAQLGASAPFLPLYRALAAQEAHARTGPVVIVQIGDSHTANDSFSGRLRELFQARFGDGGRGVLPPGVPYRYYRPARVTATMQGWVVESSFHPDVPGPFGVTGLRQHADQAAIMTLSADPGDLNRVEIEFLSQPGGGTLEVDQDTGGHLAVSTSAPSASAVWLPVPSTLNTRVVTISARNDGPVDVLAWSVSRGGQGVIYANLGTIGASVDLIDRWDPAIVQQDLAHLEPAMIVLAFGTNEGFRDDTDPDAYAIEFAAKLHELRAAAPGAALLVLGPPDGARHRRKGSVESGTCGDPNWLEPPHLAQVRDVQRNVATREGAYFWDWSAAMGGECSMVRWVATVPPFAAPDHVHLYAPGYQATAESLFHTVMEGYDRYRALRPSS